MNYGFAEFNCFASLSFSGRGVHLEGESVWMTKDLLVARRTPFAMDEFWKTQLGEIAANKVSNSNTVLIALSTGDNYEELKSYLHSFHYGLMLQGTGYNCGQEGWIIAGPVKNCELRSSSVGSMFRFHEPAKVITSAIEVVRLKRALVLAAGIDAIYSNQPSDKYLRLRKGFDAYVLGLRSNQFHIRLHQFVRAIESVVMPRRSNLKNDFKLKSKVIIGDNDESEEILNDLYELRSAAEHLSPMHSKLDRFDPDRRNDILATRSYQAEILARFAFCSVLEDVAVRDRFKSDDTIADFWTAPVFSTQVNLVAAATENYYTFLNPN